MATNKRTLSRIGFYCGLALFLIITLFSIFCDADDLVQGRERRAISLHPTLLPQQWTLEHYVDIFNPMIFRLSTTSVTVWWCLWFHPWWRYSSAFLGLTRFPACALKVVAINASFYTVYMFSGILLVVPLFKIITALGIYDADVWR